MLRIATMENRVRMSTKDLLRMIADAVAKGETEFRIAASGQHDIGGAVWSPDGSSLHFEVSNPGQRVGGMCLPGTRIVVDGSTPADTGWLNSGGEIIIKGDAGDTAGHCAAAGKIYIGGRAGARTGSLMKHDPACEPPELWVLKNTGSFSFEFMGGGKAVICGLDCMALPSTLGERPCVGMVGGCVYFRGECPELPDDAQLAQLNPDDIAFLDQGLQDFLDAIAKPQLKRDLSIWKHWQKIVPAAERREHRQEMAEYRRGQWFPAGIFNDVLQDDFQVAPLVPCGDFRLRRPIWDNEAHNCVDCRLCLVNCPKSAIKRRKTESGEPIYAAGGKNCIGCGICAAVCPGHVWRMEHCSDII